LERRFEQTTARDELGLELQVIFNKGAVMILPTGVNKATGLTCALKEMELDPQHVVAVGDAGGDAEELLEDPRVVDPVAFARRVEEECRDGWTWVLRDARGLCFRAGVSALTAQAAQVSGVYVPPALRAQGIATRALGELCARLLLRSRVVCCARDSPRQEWVSLALTMRLPTPELLCWSRTKATFASRRRFPAFTWRSWESRKLSPVSRI